MDQRRVCEVLEVIGNIFCLFYIHLCSPFTWKNRQANKQQEQ